MHSKHLGPLQISFPSPESPSNSTAHHRYAVVYNMHSGNNSSQSPSPPAHHHPFSAPPTQANFPHLDRRMSEPALGASNGPTQLQELTECFPEHDATSFAHPQPSTHFNFALNAHSESTGPPAFSNSWACVNSESPISTTPPLSPATTSLSIQIPLRNAVSLGNMAFAPMHTQIPMSSSFPRHHSDLEFEMEMDIENHYGASPPGTGTSNSSPPLSASFPPVECQHQGVPFPHSAPFSADGYDMAPSRRASMHLPAHSSSLSMRSSSLIGHGPPTHGISISLPAATITLPTAAHVLPPRSHMHSDDETSGADQRRPGLSPRQASDSKSYSFVALPGNAVKKRPRRRFDEIERLYKCEWAESGIDSINGRCTKAYGTLNHLNAHVSMQKHGPKRSPNEFKERRKQWRKAKKEQEARRTRPLGIYEVEDGGYQEGAPYEYELLDRYDERHSPHLIAHSPHVPSLSPHPPHQSPHSAHPSVHQGHPSPSYHHHHGQHPYAMAIPDIRYSSETEGRYTSSPHPEMRHASSHPNMRYSASPTAQYPPPPNHARYPSPPIVRYPPQSSVRYTQASDDFASNYRSVDRNDPEEAYRVPEGYREEEYSQIKEGRHREDHRARYGSWAPSRGMMPPASSPLVSPHSNSPPLQQPMQHHPQLTLSIPSGIMSRVQGSFARSSTDSGSSGGMTFPSTGSTRMSQGSVMSRLSQDSGVISRVVEEPPSLLATPLSGYQTYPAMYSDFGQVPQEYLMANNATQQQPYSGSDATPQFAAQPPFDANGNSVPFEVSSNGNVVTELPSSQQTFSGSPVDEYSRSPDDYDDGSGEYRED